MWFLHEYVLTGVDGCAQVRRMKTRGTRDQDDVTRVNHMPVTVESRELMPRVNPCTFGAMRLDFFERSREPVAKQVSHGHQVDAGIGIERVYRSGGAAIPAANQSDANPVASSGIRGPADIKCRQRCESGRSPEEIAPRRRLR